MFYRTLQYCLYVRYRTVWRGPFVVWVSPLVNGSDAELKVLLLEHREKKKIGTTMDLVVEVLVVMLVVVVLVTLPLLMEIVFVVFVIFGFRKNIGRGLDVW